MEKEQLHYICSSDVILYHMDHRNRGFSRFVNLRDGKGSKEGTSNHDFFSIGWVSRESSPASISVLNSNSTETLLFLRFAYPLLTWAITTFTIALFLCFRDYNYIATVVIVGGEFFSEVMEFLEALLMKIVGEKNQKWVSKMKRRICPWSLMHYPSLHISIKMKTTLMKMGAFPRQPRRAKRKDQRSKIPTPDTSIPLLMTLLVPPSINFFQGKYKKIEKKTHTYKQALHYFLPNHNFLNGFFDQFTKER